MNYNTVIQKKYQFKEYNTTAHLLKALTLFSFKLLTSTSRLLLNDYILESSTFHIKSKTISKQKGDTNQPGHFILRRESPSVFIQDANITQRAQSNSIKRLDPNPMTPIREFQGRCCPLDNGQLNMKTMNASQLHITRFIPRYSLVKSNDIHPHSEYVGLLVIRIGNSAQ